MAMSRSSALLLVVVVAAIVGWAFQSRPVAPLLPIVSVGAIDATSAKLHFVSTLQQELPTRPRPQNFSVRVWPSSSAGADDRWLTYPLAGPVTTIDNLEPDTSYGYQLVHPDGQIMAAERGSFSTLVGSSSEGELQPRSAAFLFGSCIMSQLPFGSLEPIVQLARRISPKFLLMLGDLVYADVPDWRSSGDLGQQGELARNNTFYGAYTTLWSEPSFRSLALAVPLIGMYDDHEVRDNWRGATSDEIAAALSAWQLWFGGRNPTASVVPERSYYTVALIPGVVSIFVLDTRFHRGATDSAFGMLGEEQHASLLKWLAEHPSRIKIIASGGSYNLNQYWVDPLFRMRVGQGDGWNMYAREREQLFDEIEQLQCRDDVPEAGAVLLLSGDVHWASLVRHRRQRNGLLEFGSSPMWAVPIPIPPPSHDDVEDQLHGEASANYIGAVTVELAGGAGGGGDDAAGGGDGEQEATVTLDLHAYHDKFWSWRSWSSWWVGATDDSDPSSVVRWTHKLGERELRPTPKACERWHQ